MESSTISHPSPSPSPSHRTSFVVDTYAAANCRGLPPGSSPLLTNSSATWNPNPNRSSSSFRARLSAITPVAIVCNLAGICAYSRRSFQHGVRCAAGGRESGRMGSGCWLCSVAARECALCAIQQSRSPRESVRLDGASLQIQCW